MKKEKEKEELSKFVETVDKVKALDKRVQELEELCKYLCVDMRVRISPDDEAVLKGFFKHHGLELRVLSPKNKLELGFAQYQNADRFRDSKDFSSLHFKVKLLLSKYVEEFFGKLEAVACQ